MKINWKHFIDELLYNLDISRGLAYIGIIVMNCVFIRHINISFTEGVIESLALGFALPYLIK